MMNVMCGIDLPPFQGLAGCVSYTQGDAPLCPGLGSFAPLGQSGQFPSNKRVNGSSNSITL